MTGDKQPSRRDFLRTTATTGAAVGLGSLAPTALRGVAHAAGSAAYTGELVVVGANDNPMPGRGLYKLFDTFQKAHPGVKITYQTLPSNRFVALFTAKQASGEQVDALALNGQDVRRYALAGALAPLDTISTLKEEQSRFQPYALDTYTINKHLYAQPIGAQDGFPIFVNKALLDRVHLPLPKTYADLQRINAALGKQGIATFTHQGRNIYLWPVWFFTTFAQVTGNRSIARTFQILSGKGKFTDPDVVKALDLIFQFSRDGLFSKDVLSIDTPGAQVEFLTGRAAFWMWYSSAVIQPVRAQKPPMMDLQATVMPKLVNNRALSQFPGGVGGVSLYAKIDAQRKQIAVELVDFLTTDASDAYLVQDGSEPTGVNKRARTSNDPVALQIKGLLGNMTTYLDWYWPPEVTRAFQEGIQAGVAGNLTAAAVAKDIQSTFDGLVAGGYKFKG